LTVPSESLLRFCVSYARVNVIPRHFVQFGTGRLSDNFNAAAWELGGCFIRRALPYFPTARMFIGSLAAAMRALFQ
jgi:hypothetical protein